MDMSVLTNSALAVKIKAMKGKLLTAAQYGGLIGCESVSEVAEYLKQNSVYSDIYKVANETGIHRGAMEMYLTDTNVDDYEKLYRFCGKEERKLLDLIFSLYEINAIVKVARSLYTKQTTSEELGDFLKRHIDIDTEKLSKAENMENLVELLVNTEYYKPLKALLDNPSYKDVSIFDVEMTLNIVYYKKIMDFAKKIKNKSERELFTRFYGSIIDILNINCVYRCRFNFNIESEYIYGYIIPYHFRISSDTVISMARAESRRALIEQIKQTPYANLIGDNFAIAFERFLKDMSCRILESHPYSMICLSCYFKLKEIENFNLISIIEGIRYSLNKDEIQSLIIA